MRVHIDVPNVYDNHRILTSALRPISEEVKREGVVLVKETRWSPDWHFVIGLADGSVGRATLPTEARMAPPERQILAIHGGIAGLLDHMLSDAAY